MAIKKSDLYSSLWESCDALRGSMDASQYKDYVLVMLFIKYVSDTTSDNPYENQVPDGATFDDMVKLKGKSDIGDRINKKIIAPLKEKYQLTIDADFNNPDKLGTGQERVERLTKLIAIFENPALDFSNNTAGHDDLLGDAYEYLMRNFATESGKSKGQFYTPAEVSRMIAQVLGIHEATTRPSTTIYDPTCGSGSLLLKVADAATTPLSLYGQEMDNQTAGLARMNMVIHKNEGAIIEPGASVLASPKFIEDGKLKTFDYVVANPPFSDKRWGNGFNPEDDEYNRFDGFGRPPDKQGDYAYLLHIVRSLKSTGKAACNLPHGVLFRGNAEASIRTNLIQRGLIEGIIGLPANLFYGTGIPACIVIINKKGAKERKEIYMIDASKGFIKDGNKNRLRERDIHRIVSTWQSKSDIEKYARMVGMDEIIKNDYNLNLPRYINTTEPEDRQDIEGHLKGGIPVADIEALSEYWDLCPSLKADLFVNNRPGYLDLAVAPECIYPTIVNNTEFKSFNDKLEQHFLDWQKTIEPKMRGLKMKIKPKQIISKWSEALLAHYLDQPLIDAYGVYQHLMNYWHDILQDDLYQIAADGWKIETYRIIEKNKKTGKEADKGWACDLLPKELLITHFYAEKQAEIDALEEQIEVATAEKAAMEAEYGNDGQALDSVTNAKSVKEAWETELVLVWKSEQPTSYRAYIKAVSSLEKMAAEKAKILNNPILQHLSNTKGNVTQAAVNAALKHSENEEEVAVLKRYKELVAIIRKKNKAVKESRELVEKDIVCILSQKKIPEIYTDLLIIKKYREILSLENEAKSAKRQKTKMLDEDALNHYHKLKKSEIIDIIVTDKWLDSIQKLLKNENDHITQVLTQRIQQLCERYENSLPALTREASKNEHKIKRHLKKMGFSWT